MIQIKYKPLFSIEFPHTFYKSGKSPDLIVQPTKSSQKLISTMGLHFLQTEFGGKLYAKVKTQANKDFIQNPLAEGLKFTFLLKLKNSFFQNISNLNLLKPLGNHYYFNNLVNNLSTANKPLLVSNATSKIVSDADLLPFASGSFSSAQSNTAATQTGRLEFLDSGESFQQELSNSNNIFNHSFDLHKFSGGRTRFLVDGAEKALFYSIDAGEQADTFGIIEIFYKNSLPAEYQFQATDHSITTKNYEIPFTNRATKWRYIITRKFNPAITSVTVGKTNGSPINFSLAGGTPEGVFIASSNNALPLTEEPVTGIKLSDNTNKVIIANLPNPPLNLIKTEGADTFSDILITI
ncbi:hypothetical protein GS399_01680 [Pedobacter sp. HMF7647]|uniref:Uncharacterized protein n=1 Tax=Hufsiella arboris TaxID=2695275 RepID=A0A7K1Y505_9SPHI|nr:hypothetical protein [Hufsiella arboris]MXV49666.1 hypothetical protein [Hufsiella arboris]